MLSEIPALFTRMSILPYCSLILAIVSSNAFGSSKFGAYPETSQSGFSSFNAANALLTVSSLDPKSTTFAPFSRYFLTMAYPIPLVPPVTTATLPFSIISPFYTNDFVHILYLYCIMVSILCQSFNKFLKSCLCSFATCSISG